MKNMLKIRWATILLVISAIVGCRDIQNQSQEHPVHKWAIKPLVSPGVTTAMTARVLQVKETRGNEFSAYSLTMDGALPSGSTYSEKNGMTHSSADLARLTWVTTNGFWVLFIREVDGSEYADIVLFPYDKKTSVEIRGASRVTGIFD